MIPRLFSPDEDPAADASLTVRELVTLYLRHCDIERVHCAEAAADRQRILGLFVEVRGDLKIEDCKPFHLTDFIESHPTWKSVSTRRAKANEIRAVFNWAAKEERIDKNPFKRVRYCEAERRPDLPDNVLDHVAQLANKPFEKVIRFLRLTGCRLSELCNATWNDVNLDQGIWTIPKHKSRKHTGKSKVVALIPEAVEMLREIAGVRSMDKSEFIFLNTRGGPWTRHSLSIQLWRMKKRHGIETAASLHGIRHRFGTASVAAGAPIKLISAQLGHSTVLVTEKYYVDLSGEMDAIRDAARLGIPQKKQQ